MSVQHKKDKSSLCIPRVLKAIYEARFCKKEKKCYPKCDDYFCPLNIFDFLAEDFGYDKRIHRNWF